MFKTKIDINNREERSLKSYAHHQKIKEWLDLFAKQNLNQWQILFHFARQHNVIKVNLKVIIINFFHINIVFVADGDFHLIIEKIKKYI